jgi:uncharacterized protein (DUF427 family)
VEAVMPEKFTIEPAQGTIVVRSTDGVIAESRSALVLREGDYPPVYYLPRADVAMEFLDRSDKVTHCPHKGDAAHFHIVGVSSRIENGAWSYETPKKGAEAIAGCLAFYPEQMAIEAI